MAEILMKAASFVAIIILGYVLKCKGFFKEEDFGVLSKIVLKIALPAAIVYNFSGASLEPSMLILSLFGFMGGALFVVLGVLLSNGKHKGDRPFFMVNLSGYNIGNFTMPFVQNFLGSAGVVATSLFDVGNAFICLGGSYSVASAVKNGEGRISFVPILKTLIKSVPFDVQFGMALLTLLHFRLPAPVISLAGIIANANAFLAMLMIGVGFKLSGDREQMGKIVKILSVRYGISILLSLGFFFLAPLAQEYRQALALLFLSPLASANPAFTGELKEDVGLASAVNSISIVISIVLITSALLVIL